MKNKVATYDYEFDPRNDPKFSEIMNDFLNNPYLESNQVKFSNYAKDNLGLNLNMDTLIEDLSAIKEIAIKTAKEFGIDGEKLLSW
ncbi:hypothetical protein [Methanobrevibacter sp.]|uniref:hypothetical protein n=1 Tax=Methanobrevibacter sp. TaxID=66852 RepID=UPI0025E2572B|nr:hypothetical protein [Methanobrevibacter sp.]MBR4447016.1 hypothetical protein [Methanobrevibacter sp.]